MNPREVPDMPRGIPNNPGINKTNIVRQALSELGRDAKPKQISAWAKKKLKVTLDPKSLSSLKTTVNKETAAETSPPNQPAPAEPGLSKLEALRRALNTLGPEAKPMDLRGFIQEKLGLE